MTSIRFANQIDMNFLLKFDTHISNTILKESIENKRIYLLESNGEILGWLRYNLFWDNTPFMNMLFVLEEYRKKGYGIQLLKHWEEDMRLQGFLEVMTSTLVFEDAIHFYLKYGYKVVGGFHPSDEEYEVILKKNVF